MKLPRNTKKSSEQITLSYSQALPESQGEILLRGGRFVTPTFYKNKFFVHIGVHIKMHIKL
jgi:hypothetical protein